MSSARIERVDPSDATAVREFSRLPIKIYGGRASYFAQTAYALFAGEQQNPFLEGREFHALIARRSNRTIGRVVAIIDNRYRAHWDETVGHLVMFDVSVDAGPAAVDLLQEAMRLLQGRNCTAARAGFGPWEPGFLVDTYHTISPRFLRHTAPWYHAALKQAGFEVEKAGAEYIAQVTHEAARFFTAQYQSVSECGYRIVGLSGIPKPQRITDACATWNNSFAQHWGLAPMTRSEFELLLDGDSRSGLAEFSAILYTPQGDAVGLVLAGQDPPYPRFVFPSRYSTQRANTFAIGIDEAHRGRNLATGLASHAYLRLIERGARRLSYGIVLHNNVPSRRSALKLGCVVRSNFVTYRSEFI